VAPVPLPANRFVWYVYQRCSTQWVYSQFSGTRLNLNYDPVMECFKEGGFRGFDFFDQLERMQVIELEMLSMESEARQIEQEREETRKRFRKQRGAGEDSEDLPRHRSA
jgi:hypothetical protein